MIFSNKKPDTFRERFEDILKLLGISAITALALSCGWILLIKYH